MRSPAHLDLRSEILQCFLHNPVVDNQGTLVNHAHVAQYLDAHDRHSNEFVRLVRAWARGRRVGEIGPGYGQTLLALSADARFDVEAFELPENIPVYCRALLRRGVPVHPFNIYSKPLGIPEQSLDICILSEVIEHLYIDICDVRDRVRPALTVGGHLIISTPNIYRLANIWRVLVGQNITERHPPDPSLVAGNCVDSRHHPREYTYAELASAFSKAGWQLREIRTVSYHHPRRPAWMNRLAVLASMLRPMALGDVVIVVAERVA
jgi:2-polyprenyl-3-methyl-5-hydroxy-6-metoxy-1,4-benzoquinol methylase